MSTDTNENESSRKDSVKLLEPQAACRERSNESNLRGECMRCGAKQGEACGDPLK